MYTKFVLTFVASVHNALDQLLPVIPGFLLLDWLDHIPAGGLGVLHLVSQESSLCPGLFPVNTGVVVNGSQVKAGRYSFVAVLFSFWDIFGVKGMDALKLSRVNSLSDL